MEGDHLMSRFMKEITGELGKFWVDSATKEVESAIKMANDFAIVEDDGAIRWTTNGCYVPDDFCEKLEYAGYDFNRQATNDKRCIQKDEAISKYKKTIHKHKYTEEELCEIRSEFGNKQTIINMFTGKQIKL